MDQIWRMQIPVVSGGNCFLLPDSTVEQWVLLSNTTGLGCWKWLSRSQGTLCHGNLMEVVRTSTLRNVRQDWRFCVYSQWWSSHNTAKQKVCDFIKHVSFFSRINFTPNRPPHHSLYVILVPQSPHCISPVALGPGTALVPFATVNSNPLEVMA
jgi:hypothetical protein